ncbi:MAG TPA: 30S ribosomal protein S20 [Deltaproteobacteria bacterium]|nr:30S ribosomal protein S20 [Deltaproteobacteria bacterium]
MAHHKDAIKRIKQNEKQRTRNRHYRTKMRNQIKRLRGAVESGNTETAQTELRAAVSIIQRLASKGVIHRNQAARRVQRLAKAVKGMSA